MRDFYHLCLMPLQCTETTKLCQRFCAIHVFLFGNIGTFSNIFVKHVSKFENTFLKLEFSSEFFTHCLYDIHYSLKGFRILKGIPNSRKRLQNTLFLCMIEFIPKLEEPELHQLQSLRSSIQHCQSLRIIYFKVYYLGSAS